MSRDRKEAERAARRARRLAERADERAKRKERHAERAADRADRLAERVRRRPGREKELDQSIEDMVDEVTEKAEAWIEEQTHRLFEPTGDDRDIRKAESRARKAKQEADRARENARRAGVAADELDEVEASLHDEDDMSRAFGVDEDFDDGMTSRQRRRASRKARRREKWRQYGYGGNWHGMDWGYDDWGFGSGRSRRRPRSAHLYRDRQRKKVCGVCAGLADYFGRPTWEMRLYAVLGLIFIPSVTVPAYFILYFLMDDKPLYRRVTDRFDESTGRKRRQREQEPVREEEVMSRKRSEPPKKSNVEAMKEAKGKFADIEQRLREMETHVTSSTFELQRELKKISGDD